MDGRSGSRDSFSREDLCSKWRRWKTEEQKNTYCCFDKEGGCCAKEKTKVKEHKK